jgi:hypothetical protein
MTKSGNKRNQFAGSGVEGFKGYWLFVTSHRVKGTKSMIISYQDKGI